jgi:hypothetical protein
MATTTTRAHSERAAETTAAAGDKATAAASTAKSTHAERAAEPIAGAIVEAGAAGSTAVERAPEAVAAPSEVGSTALRTMSRMIYVSSYAVAYGIVYATVFVAQSLPQDNPVMHGFRDGGQAAMDELSQAERVDGSEPVSEAASAQPA